MKIRTHKVFPKTLIFLTIGIILIIAGYIIKPLELEFRGYNFLNFLIIYSGIILIINEITTFLLKLKNKQSKQTSIIVFLILVMSFGFIIIKPLKDIINASKSQSNYFVIVDNNDILPLSEIEKHPIFGDKINYNESIVVVNSTFDINFIKPLNWNSKNLTVLNSKNLRAFFYYNNDIRFNEVEIDSIVNNKLSLIAKKSLNLKFRQY